MKLVLQKSEVSMAKKRIGKGMSSKPTEGRLIGIAGELIENSFDEFIEHHHIKNRILLLSHRLYDPNEKGCISEYL